MSTPPRSVICSITVSVPSTVATSAAMKSSAAEVLGSVPAGRRHVCPGALQTCRDGGADPAGAAADERALAGEALGSGSPARRSRRDDQPAYPAAGEVKSHFSSAVPPGKLPVRRPVTTYRSGSSATVPRTSVVYVYLDAGPICHARISAVP